MKTPRHTFRQAQSIFDLLGVVTSVDAGLFRQIGGDRPVEIVQGPA